jgi:hypothetical protein
LMAARTEKVGLGDWKLARLTWALASTAATRQSSWPTGKKLA